ncbi:hypothetical protein [Paraburkholderia antibiotica]|uniref:Uncharacterized protein n=1 Tax=Paraburkholderia antibiotica TaxID=2728839 RepID=A0A7X9X5S8_9BURK|nr:hypothetical protein [Paraburkholderia antibiotica]NML32012.1 hypothetical protein [Paraburkholderia antibiotica]
MKKALICVALALLMTIPVGVGIAHIPWVYQWFGSGAGYEFYSPLFDALGADGTEENSEIIVGSLYLLGFVVSLVFVVIGWAIVGRLRRRRRWESR